MKIPEAGKAIAVADGTSIAVVFATFFDYLPKVTALLAAVWVLIRLATAWLQFYELWTGKPWRERRR